LAFGDKGYYSEGNRAYNGGHLAAYGIKAEKFSLTIPGYEKSHKTSAC
ncbi:unnamed protein product, partial [marine sediment metagenome]